jgi:flagellar P-ring protein precursor FlgI
MKTIIKISCVAALLLLLPISASAERVKDLASVLGVRDNQLLGYGLVVGLDGTGDVGSPHTIKSTVNMLAQLGVNLPQGVSVDMKSLAAVLVTATLPSFARPGQTMDITISAIGNAKSLRGGTLVMTPLKGADGQIYGMAQGSLLIGEMAQSGATVTAAPGGAGAKVTPNNLIVGRIPSGATVERAVPTTLGNGDYVLLTLNTADFTTATRLTDAINKELANDGPDIAFALDGRAVRIRAPQGLARVAFVSRLENLQIEPAQAAARVIINSRTGSVVMNQAVTLEMCSISHGNMSVIIQNDVDEKKSTAESKEAVAGVDKKENKSVPGTLMLMPKAVSLNEVIRALNAIGATSKDLVAILQSMKSSGALHAELEII